MLSIIRIFYFDIFNTDYTNFRVPLPSVVPKISKIGDNTGFRPECNQAKVDLAGSLTHHSHKKSFLTS